MPRCGTLIAIVVSTTVSSLMTALIVRGQDRPDQLSGNRLLGLPPLSTAGDTPEKILLGKRLFYERAMSADNTRACASCHLPLVDFSDSDALSMGAHGRRGSRHSLPVVNAAFLKWYMWDGRAKTLETQALLPLGTAHEMNMSHGKLVVNLKKQGLEPQFKRIFADGITTKNVAAAMSAYERTLIAGDSPFDRFHFLKDKSALNEQQQRGLVVFNKAQCASCHTIGDNQSWTLLTDGSFHNIGVGMRNVAHADPGRFAITHKPEDYGAFRTPSLRNVALRPPFFHDGSAATLEQAVDFHIKGGGKNKNLDPLLKPVALSKRDKAALLAFLDTLTSSHMKELLDEALPSDVVH